MRHLRTPPSALRSAAVLALAALCLHQLVYLLSFGANSGPALQAGGHGYMSIAGPLLASLAFCGIVGTLVAAAHRVGGARRTTEHSWLTWAAVLLAVFVAQEATESLLGSGGLAGLVSLAHTSAGTAVLAAIAVGRLVGLALSGLGALDAKLARAATRRRPRRSTAVRAPLSRSPLHFPRLTLAFGFSRRPPPAAAS